jgi:type III secretion protein C
MKKIAASFKFSAALSLALACLSAGPGVVNAAPVPWAEQEVKITIKEQRLKEVLRGIFDTSLVPVQIDPAVDGTLKDVRYNLKPQQLIDLLSRQFSFAVYFDGQSAYVTPSAANVSRVFKLDRNAQAQARRILSSLNLVDLKFPIRFDESGRIASVSGPVRYVSAVEAALNALEDTGGSAMRGDVRIFSLSNGIAADRSVTIGSSEIVIPGVASLLRKIYKPQSGGERVEQTKQQRPSQAQRPGANPMNAMLRSIGGREAASEPMQDDGLTTVTAIESREARELPIIEAIPQINAIAIRDVGDRLRLYEEVIKRLDVKPSVVLAEVSIIEISSGVMDKVGVDWRLGNARGGFSTSSTQSPNANSAIPVDGRGVVPAINGGFAFLSGLGRSSLVQAQVYAMVDDGSAKVISTPRIVTMLNEEGLFSNNSTFYARVAGNLEANLFAIESGTSIRITPLSLMNEGDNRAMRFAVRIEDGRFSERTVDNLPVTQKSTILTSAIVPIGQSLALAGLTEESTSSNTRGIPGLSSLPGIGALFRTKSDERRSVQRVYLITPRILE